MADKFSFGDYDDTQNAEVFTTTKGYDDANSEESTRRQLSFPLTEIKNFINKILPVKTSNTDTLIQLGVGDDKMLRFREAENGAWKDVASEGHIIETVENGQTVTFPQRSVLQFLDVDISDDSVNKKTVIRGFEGPEGPQGPQGETGPAGPTGPQGPSGNNFEIDGIYATLSDLQTAHPTGNSGDAYAVGTSASNTVYVWSADESEWQDVGALMGAQGPQGETGATGPAGPAGVGIATGGIAGQYLAKKSSTNYDTEWATFQYPTVDQAYSGTSVNAQSGKAVKQAIDDLDGVLEGDTIGGLSNTLAYLRQTDGKIYYKFGKISIFKSQILDFSHTHGQITNAGTISSSATPTTSDHIVIADASDSYALKRTTYTNLLKLIYPKNSVYATYTNTNPSDIIGGTWSLINSDGKVGTHTCYLWRRTAL